MKKRKKLLPTEAEQPSLPSTPTAETKPYEVSSVPIDAYGGKQDLYIILGLLLAAFSVRFYSLQFFHVISTDGTSYALNARSFAHGDLHGIGISGFYPVLIAIANMFINDLETAGRIVSVVLGSLLVLPLYLLGKSIFSRATAIAACMIAIVWPPLVNFSCEVMTQATHTTLQLSAVYLFWRAFKKPTALNGGLAGLLIGLTYLTRPESILLFITMPLALLIFNYKDLRKNRQLIAAYCGSFLLPFIVNMLLVHNVTGEWQLSAKTDSALNDALSYYLNIPDLNYIPGYKPKGYLDILKDHPGFIWHNSAKNLKSVWETMLTPILWFFFAVGFFSNGFEREKNTVRLLLLSTLTPVAVLIVFYYISGGYIEAYQPFMFLFAAAGFAATERKLKRYIPLSEKFKLLQRTPFLILAALIYAAVIFVPQIRKNVSDAEYLPTSDNYRRAEKIIGRLLKDSLPPGKIMTRWARIAFYAEREWVNIPAQTPLEEVIALAKKSGVRFLVIDGLLYDNRPMLGMELFEPLRDEGQPYGTFYHENPDNFMVKGLRPFLIYTNPRSMGVVVYEIGPEPG